VKLEDLTPFHLTALLQFHGVRALTETGLARVLKVEKATAKHALNVLTSTELVKRYGSWEYVITKVGTAHLVEKKLIKPEKATTKARTISTVSEAVGKLVASESKALKKVLAPTADLTEVALADTKHQFDLVVDAASTTIAAEAVHSLPPADPEPAPMPALDLTAPADFDTLVRQGLARLNAQLGLQPVVIDRLELKIDTLGELAGVIGQVDTHLEDLLLAVVKDLQRIADRSSK
jgi:predicted transcriptional regulator